MEHTLEHYVIAYDTEALPVVQLSYANNGWNTNRSEQMDRALAQSTGQRHIDAAYVLNRHYATGQTTVEEEGVVRNGIHLSRPYNVEEERRLSAMGFVPTRWVSIGVGQGDGELFIVEYEGHGLRVSQQWSGHYAVVRKDEKRPMGWHELKDLAAAVRGYVGAGS